MHPHQDVDAHADRADAPTAMDVALAPSMVYCLGIVYPRDADQCFKLGVAPRTIGSGRNADIVLNDERIAPIHCRVSVGNDGVVRVDDLGAASGTWVDGQRVREAELEMGQILGVGHYRFMLSQRELSVRETRSPKAQPPGKDRLTGVPNRSWILQRADALLAARAASAAPVTLAMIAIDGLQEVSARQGYEASDRLMRGVGRFLESVLMGKEQIGRFGTERFLLLMPEQDRDSASERLQALCAQAPQQRFEHAGEMLTAYLSIGYATRRGDEVQSLDVFLALAERGLYRARRWGGNQVIAWENL